MQSRQTRNSWMQVCTGLSNGIYKSHSLVLNPLIFCARDSDSVPVELGCEMNSEFVRGDEMKEATPKMHCCEGMAEFAVLGTLSRKFTGRTATLCCEGVAAFAVFGLCSDKDCIVKPTGRKARRAKLHWQEANGRICRGCFWLANLNVG